MYEISTKFFTFKSGFFAKVTYGFFFPTEETEIVKIRHSQKQQYFLHFWSGRARFAITIEHSTSFVVIFPVHLKFVLTK